MTAMGKTTKVSADALDDNQFIVDAQGENEQQQEPSTGDQPAKKKRKRNNKKPQAPVQPTAEPSGLDPSEASHNEPSKDENIPPKKKSKKSKKSQQLTPSTPDEKKPTIASAARLKRSKEKKQAKAKLKRKLQKETENKMEASASDTLEESINESSSIGLQPPDLQLNYLKDRQKRAFSDLSDLELESFPLEKAWLQDVSDKPLRANLGPWLKSEAIPGLLKALNKTAVVPGAPVVLIITSAALRAADLFRQMKPLVEKPKKSGEITKLFAKHFKLEGHIEHVKATKISIGIGTPHRISTLLSTKNEAEEVSQDREETAALKLTRLKFVILDLTWLDPKGYNLTELPDSNLKNALWKSFLGLPELIKKFQAGETKLVIF